jgi:hypothetical protein
MLSHDHLPRGIPIRGKKCGRQAGMRRFSGADLAARKKLAHFA